MGTAFSAATTSIDKKTFVDPAVMMASLAQHFQGFGNKVSQPTAHGVNVMLLLRMPESHFTMDPKKLELAMDIAICKLPARGR